MTRLCSKSKALNPVQRAPSFGPALAKDGWGTLRVTSSATETAKSAQITMTRPSKLSIGQHADCDDFWVSLCWHLNDSLLRDLGRRTLLKLKNLLDPSLISPPDRQGLGCCVSLVDEPSLERLHCRHRTSSTVGTTVRGPPFKVCNELYGACHV